MNQTNVFPVLVFGAKGAAVSSKQYEIGLVTTGATGLELTKIVSESVNEIVQLALLTEIRLISESPKAAGLVMLAEPLLSKTTV